jgi:hypothetical protein
MAVRGNITLTDAATTPVARVYYPQKMVDGLISWIDRTQAVLLGQNRLTLSQRVANKQARSNKISWKLECPVLEQTAAYGPYSLAYTNLAALGLVFHERASLQERKDVLAQVRDLIDEAIVTTQVHDLDFIY